MKQCPEVWYPDHDILHIHTRFSGAHISVLFQNADIDTITPLPQPALVPSPTTATSAMTTPSEPPQPATSIHASTITPPEAPALPTTPPPPDVTTPLTSLPQALSRPETSDLKAKMERLEKSFKHLVQSTENSFHKNGIKLEKIQASIKFIPITLRLLLGECFQRQAINLLKAESIEQLFFELSYFWDYLNPGLLQFLVKEFGSQDDNSLMTMYLQELKNFRCTVKIGEFIKASQADTNIHSFIYTKIVTVMDPRWANKTLEDAEQFKIEVCNECHLPQSFTTRILVQRSSVAIVFYIPRQIEICLEDLKPLLQRKQVDKVYVENICVIDWTKQVR